MKNSCYNCDPDWVDKLTDDEVKDLHRAICDEMDLPRQILRLVDESESPDELARLRDMLKTAFPTPIQ